MSVLSPYLRYRLLTEEEVIATALARHGSDAASKFAQEVGWRTYWKGWLELRPAVWQRFLEQRDAARGSGLMRAVAQAEALTEPALPMERPLPSLPDGTGRPALLLLTPEDLCREQIWPERGGIGGDVRAGLAVRGVRGWPWSQAAGFVSGAVEDAANRSEAALSCRVAVVDTLEADTVVKAARGAGAEAMVTAYAPVGPVADTLGALEERLTAAGLAFVRVRRGVGRAALAVCH